MPSNMRTRTVADPVFFPDIDYQSQNEIIYRHRLCVYGFFFCMLETVPITKEAGDTLNTSNFENTP